MEHSIPVRFCLELYLSPLCGDTSSSFLCFLLTPTPSPLSQPYFSSLCQLFISLVIFMPWPCQWPPWALVKWPYNYCIYGDWEFIGHDSGPWSEKVSYHKMFSCINHVLSVALDILGVIKITKTSLCSLEVSSRQGSKNHYGTGRSIN